MSEARALKRPFAPYDSIPLLTIFKYKVERFKRFLRGDNRNNAPSLLILFLDNFNDKIERVVRFIRGDNKNLAPSASI